MRTLVTIGLFIPLMVCLAIGQSNGKGMEDSIGLFRSPKNATDTIKMHLSEELDSIKLPGEQKAFRSDSLSIEIISDSLEALEKEVGERIDNDSDPWGHYSEGVLFPTKVGYAEYPPEALKEKIRGTVWVRMLVDRGGKVHKAIIQKTDNAIFNRAALVAAMKYEFEPPKIHGGFRAGWVSIPFRFTLPK